MTIQDPTRLLAENGTRTEKDELLSLRAMINFNYSRWIWFMTGNIRVNDTRKSAKAFDPTGRLRYQLIKDKLMSEDETIIQAYTRFYKEKKSRIYTYD